AAFNAAKITGSSEAHIRQHVAVYRLLRVFSKQPASKGLEKRFKRRLRNERPSPSLGDGCAVDGEQRLNPSANLESDDVEVTRAFRENDLGYRWNHERHVAAQRQHPLSALVPEARIC